MPVIHDTPMFKIEVADDNSNMVTVYHKGDETVSFMFWPDHMLRNDDNTSCFVIEPNPDSKIELDTNAGNINIRVSS